MNDRTNEPDGTQETAGQLIIPGTRSVPAMRNNYGPLVEYPGTLEDATEPSWFNLLEYWRILNKRKWLILSVAAAFVVLAAVRTLMQTPLYTATMRLQVDPNEAKIVQGESIMPVEGSDEQFMQTQYELLQSRTMAERVASTLKLGSDPNFLKPREFSIVRTITQMLSPSHGEEGANATALEGAAAGIVSANLSVRPIPRSRLVDLSYTDPSPQRAQEIANAYGDAYLASNLDKRFQANASAKTFLEDKIQQLKLRLEDSERRQLDFAQKEQIVDTGDQSSIAENNLAAANGVLVKLIDEYQQKLEIFKPAYPQMVQLANQIKETEKRVNILKQEVLDLQKRSIQYNILKREVNTNRELYTSLLQRYKEVDVASGVSASNVFVIDKALLPGSPSSPQLFRALQIALALGLAAGFGIAYMLERLDDKICSVEQLELISSLSTLGVIPKIGDADQELADSRSALWEAYRSLCTALQFATESGLPKTLAITSSGPAEGKSLTSIAIAKHFANLGRKVLLVDADLRNPSLHTKLGCDNSTGLSNYLTGVCSPPEVMQDIGIPNLAFIASGPLPPNAADLLSSARVLSLLSIGSEVFDLVVIDGPPVLGLADALLLSSAAAATIFVVAATTRKGLVKGALRRLQTSRTSVLGVVLTKYDAKSAGYGYGYGYGYGSEYAYGADANSKGPSVPSASTPQLADLRERLANLRKSA